MNPLLNKIKLMKPKIKQIHWYQIMGPRVFDLIWHDIGMVLGTYY
jgi:hypothetical protein